jgi:WD40 repeat protein
MIRINILKFKRIHLIRIILLFLIIVCSNISSQNRYDSHKINKTTNTIPIFSWEGSSCGIISNMAFNRDYSLFATAGFDKYIRIWDAYNFNLKKTLYTGSLSINRIVFSNDGKNIAICDQDNAIKILSIEDEKILITINQYPFSSEDIAFSPDDSYLASANVNETHNMWNVSLWKTSDGSMMHTLAGYNGKINCILFSKDGKQLLTGGQENILKIWNVNTWKQDTSFSNENAINTLKISKDGKKVYINSNNGNISIRNAQNWNIIKNLTTPVYPIIMDISEDESKIIAGDGKDLVLLNPDGNIITKYKTCFQFISTAKFNNDGTKIISTEGNGNSDLNSRQNGTIKIWNTDYGILYKELTGHSSPVTSIAISPDGKKIASAGMDFKVKLWDFDANLCSKSLIPKEHFPVNNVDKYFFINFSPRGSFLVTNGWGLTKLFTIFDSLKELKNFTYDANILNNIYFSGNEKKCLLNFINSAYTWSTETWEPVDTLSSIEEFGSSKPGYFIGDSILFTFYPVKIASLWNLNSRKLIKSFNYELNGNIIYNGISESGKIFYYTFSKDGFIQINLYNLENGSLLKSFVDPNVGITSIDISKDDNMLVTSFMNGVINIWDWKNGNILKMISYERGYPNSVRFTPDSKKIIAGGTGYNNIRIYDISDIISCIEEKSENIPKKSMLYRNYPNPFNPSTTICYTVGTPGITCVQLKIYDILGREVRTLIEENKTAGDYSITFNAGNLPSGIYFYKLILQPMNGSKTTLNRSMIMLK